VEPGHPKASLARRIADGDRSAEAEFAATFRRGIHTLVRRHCRPLEPAVDDLAQEVLIGVLEKLRGGALRDEAALPAYIRSAVQLTVQAAYRKRGRRGEDSPGADMDVAEAADIDDPAQRAQGDPAHQLHREQLGRLVHRVLGEMDVARDREVLRRFYLLEHDRDTVCHDLGIDIQHFRRVLFRARERFGACARREGLENVT
jgi:RNA polymerase sigma-70 factor, ECF subfamily